MSDETLYDLVDAEARHDWLDELPVLRADARPDPSEYEENDRCRP